MRRIISTAILILALAACAGSVEAQSSTPVTPTGETQMMNGTKYYIHIVQQGQTVFSISRAFGMHYSSAVLKTDIHSLSVGDTVWIPFNDQSQAAVKRAIGIAEAAVPTQEIVVAQGQTIYSICKNYGVTDTKLYELNPGLKEEGLKAGQTLHLPIDAKPKSSSPTQPKTATATQPKPSTPAQPKPQQPSQPKSEPKPATPSTGQYHYDQPKESSAPAATTKPAQSAQTVQLPAIRERISKDKVCISLLIPLRLDRMNEISTTKFDVEQRGKKDYRSFEFIQFYEGVLMGIDELGKAGVSVSLNVVDVSTDNAEEIAKLYNSHNVSQSDLIIALLPHTGFDAVAGLAKRDHVFIVSPFTLRADVLNDNPYAIKYMPSNAGMVGAALDAIKAQYPGSPVFVIHSNSKNETAMKNELEKQLKMKGIEKYGFVDWTQNSKLLTTLKGANHPVVISIYDQGKDKNRIYTNLLLNRLSSLKSDPPVLYTFTNFIKDIPDVDFGQLQTLRYHLFYPAYLDYNTNRHEDFIENFKNQYKTQPVNDYAPIGHDLVVFFATGISRRGTAFWSNPNAQKPDGMLFPIHFVQTPSGGFENQAAMLYEMIDFHLQPVNATRY